ncbi:MAG: DNA methyltransferase [bacterium]
MIDCLQNGKEIPEVYKYALFPTKQKEYELVYAGKMRKEDVLADTEEAKPVPLQIEKIFNGEKYPLYSKDWRNLLIFGDNLQILKTIYEDKDLIIKGKVRGKVKLIYIDPPFGTGDEYDGNKGQSAYSAKRKGADFVEFIRRRIILLKELLTIDGFIVVRQAYNFGHYIKIILDEIFGKSNFVNEIIINRKRQSMGSQNRFEIQTESLFIYSNSNESKLNSIYKKRASIDFKWTGFLKQEIRNPRERIFLGKKLLPPPNQHFSLIQEKVDKLLKDNFLRLSCRDCGSIYYYDENNRKEQFIEYILKSGTNKFKYADIAPKNIVYGLKEVNHCLNCNNDNFKVEYLPSDNIKINNIWLDIPSYTDTTGYPTENSELLVERIIKSLSNDGDLIMDVFAGSGTTAVVAEKLNRRWITCDIGKLSIYTIQKRLLSITTSKDLENKNKKYEKSAKSFSVITSGLYDLGKIFALHKDEYINFVKDLFEIDDVKIKTIGGIEINGKKRDFYVKIFPFWELNNVSINEEYLQELHKNIGKKIDGRFYIIAPANNIDFISDYYQISDIRYYFLKVPYQVIKELHKVKFKKLRQPQSKSQINDLDDAIGFHFIRTPEVLSDFQILENSIILKTKKFETAYSKDEAKEKFDNFESLAMLLFDLDYDGEKFIMTNYYFAEDLIGYKLDNNGTEESENDEKIKNELKKQKEISIEFLKKDCGTKIMAIYIDIYGNEFKEVFNLSA